MDYGNNGINETDNSMLSVIVGCFAASAGDYWFGARENNPCPYQKNGIT
jgi:hypothetical protein